MQPHRSSRAAPSALRAAGLVVLAAALQSFLGPAVHHLVEHHVACATHAGVHHGTGGHEGPSAPAHAGPARALGLLEGARDEHCGISVLPLPVTAMSLPAEVLAVPLGQPGPGLAPRVVHLAANALARAPKQSPPVV
jgi:hypothetical protein